MADASLAEPGPVDYLVVQAIIATIEADELATAEGVRACHSGEHE